MELIRSRIRSLRHRYARLRSSIGTESQLLTVEQILDKLDETMHTSLISKIVNFELWGRLHLLWREDPEFKDIIYDADSPLRLIHGDIDVESLSDSGLSRRSTPQVNTTSKSVTRETSNSTNPTVVSTPISTTNLKRKRGHQSSFLAQSSNSVASSTSAAGATSEAHLERMEEMELKKRRIEEDLEAMRLRETELKLNHEYNMGKQQIIMKALRLLDVNLEAQKAT
ncbi:hypothetical protein JR316_0013037 [Psilocybe cubensis]|uniref:Uncharacterized protein n=1 Tax=Psilocybe cubensis TaxID=181762 RepID=A0ACB8GHP1_PSICU|nr:hypothetical protein JR316_0013037 [Psilocybe cubensis]KAH9474575.1 hypothetical protein JR316_0013037 [Psilocybe cubensis]